MILGSRGGAPREAGVHSASSVAGCGCCRVLNNSRSPVIIPKDRFAEWLDPDLTDKADVQHLLDSLPEPTLTPRIVSTRANSVRNNGPELIEPAEPAPK